jgi:hypothetical protein
MSSPFGMRRKRRRYHVEAVTAAVLLEEHDTFCSFAAVALRLQDAGMPGELIREHLGTMTQHLWHEWYSIQREAVWRKLTRRTA